MSVHFFSPESRLDRQVVNETRGVPPVRASPVDTHVAATRAFFTRNLFFSSRKKTIPDDDEFEHYFTFKTADSNDLRFAVTLDSGSDSGCKFYSGRVVGQDDSEATLSDCFGFGLVHNAEALIKTNLNRNDEFKPRHVRIAASFADSLVDLF